MDETDLLGEIRGESLSPMDTPVDGSEPHPTDSILWDIFTAWTSPVTAVTGLLGNVVDSGETIILTTQERGQQFWSGAVEDVSEAANPANLFGLGLGVTVGGVAAATTLAVIGAFAADQVFFAGMGTRSLISRVAR